MTRIAGSDMRALSMPKDRRKSYPVATIGYELATPAGLLRALQSERIELLVDVRALANSRRPGFAKTRLTASLAHVGIDYLHLRALGTPVEGRAAARAGHHDRLRSIYLEHLDTPSGRAELESLAGLVSAGRRVCLLCLEANPAHCHRSLVAEALRQLVPVIVTHLSADGAPEG